MLSIIEEVQKVLKTYLDDLLQTQYYCSPSKVLAAQDHYCLQQRRNEHTVRAIKNLLGEDRANEFVTKVLFPTHEA